MKAKLFRRNEAEPLCDVVLEVRGDPTFGAPFEARLTEADAHRVVELEGAGVLFEADAGGWYEGTVQHAFRAPRGGGILQGGLRERPRRPR